MISLVLRTSTRLVIGLLLLFSIFMLLRGHDLPGGGFIAGLVGASAFAVYALAYDPQTARGVLRVDPRHLAGIGLGLAGASGLFGMVLGQPFLTGQWTDLTLPGFGEAHVGTPLLFDIGVYLVVVGVLMTVILALIEEE